MPRRRAGHTTSVTIGGERFYMTANSREDGSLGEVFIQWGKQGHTSAGLMDIYAVALSVGLQHGVPLVELLRQGIDLCFLPNGHTDDPDFPRARSVVDWAVRRLAADWLSPEVRGREGIFTVDFSERPTEREVSDLWSDVADLFATQCTEERQPENAVAAPVDGLDGMDAAALAAFRAELANGIGAPMALRS
jgi:ribonucleoside-diphosphate reductase alpha chain